MLNGLINIKFLEVTDYFLLEENEFLEVSRFDLIQYQKYLILVDSPFINNENQVSYGNFMRYQN